MRAMTKRILSLALTLAMVLSLCLTVQAKGSVTVTLDGRALELTAPAYVDGNGRTQVPVTIGPQLGLTYQQKEGEVTFVKGEASLTFRDGEKQAGGMTMDTAADLSGSVGYVPLVYLARFFGIQVAWDGVSRTVSLTGSAGLTVADISSIQAYTDMTFYGQGLVSVEITYRPGVDVSGVTAQSYILEDRGTLSPDFGRIEIAGVSVQGQTVTLSIAENTGATSNNKMIYTGDQKEGSRERNAFGIYCTGAWYRDVNGAIYYGKEDTAEYRANTTGMGYQARPCLELRLRHTGEAESASACLANEKGQYNAGGLWKQTIDANFGEGGFQTFEELGIQVESTAKNAKDVVPDQYVRGYLYVPEDYTGDEEVPLVVTISGNGTSFWILEDGTNNFGTNIMYDAATTSWIGKGAIVVGIHDRSIMGGNGEDYDYLLDDVNVIKYLLEHYNIDRDRIIIHGNCASTPPDRMRPTGVTVPVPRPWINRYMTSRSACSCATTACMAGRGSGPTRTAWRWQRPVCGHGSLTRSRTSTILIMWRNRSRRSKRLGTATSGSRRTCVSPASPLNCSTTGARATTPPPGSIIGTLETVRSITALIVILMRMGSWCMTVR